MNTLPPLSSSCSRSSSMCKNETVVTGNFLAHTVCTAHTGQHGSAFTARLPCTTILLPYSLEATAALWGMRTAPLKPFGFQQKGCHKSATHMLEELWSMPGFYKRVGFLDVIVVVFFNINPHKSWAVVPCIFPLMNIAWIPTWLASQPQSLIKSLWNGEVNYVLTPVAPINYSLGAFQTAEAYVPFLTKLVMARQN